MNLPAKRQPTTVRLRRLASELLNLRQSAGLSREDVAEATSINPATLYRIESGKARPQRRTLMALLDQYGVADTAKRAELVELTKHANQLAWLESVGDELTDQYATYISLESDAAALYAYEPLFVPGLLQTADYARAVISGVLPHLDDEAVDHRVQVRMRRQELLRKPSPLRLWCIIDQSVLSRRVGGEEVQRQQIEHLATMAELPNVTLQAIPFLAGAHPGMPGAFSVLRFPDSADNPIVYVDSFAGETWLERPVDVDRAERTFAHLRATALSPLESRRLILDSAKHITGVDP